MSTPDQEFEALVNYAFECNRIKRSAEMGAAIQAVSLAVDRCQQAGCPLTDKQYAIIRGAILNSLLTAENGDLRP